MTKKHIDKEKGGCGTPHRSGNTMKNSNYLRISPSVSVPKTDVECVCFYDSRPVSGFFSRAKEDGKGFKTDTGAKSIIITKNGDTFLSPYLVKTYIDKLNEGDFIKTDSRCCILESEVKQIITRLNRQYSDLIKEKKKNNLFLNVARGKKVTVWVLTKSGMVYACRKITGN